MSQTSTPLTLALLPVPDGVVFPGTVVTIALDDPDAAAAVAAARAGEGRVVLVPVVDGRYADVGTIAQVEQHRQLRRYDSFMKTGRVKFRGRQQRFM